MLVLLSKLLLAPACVAGASLVARRWGARVGGLVGGLPVVGGPILLVLALMHGRGYGAEAAAASLLGLLALTVFVVAYGHVSLRAHPVASVLAGWAAFLGAVALLAPLEVPRGVALALMFVAFAGAGRVLPRPPAGVPEPRVPGRWDIPVRMGAAAALVLTLSAASSRLGAHVSGLLSPFPIITAVMAGFTHHHQGHLEVQALLRGFLAGYYGYGMFCFTVAVALPGMALGPAFGLAAATAIVTQIVVAGVTGAARRRPRRAAEAAAAAG